LNIIAYPVFRLPSARKACAALALAGVLGSLCGCFTAFAPKRDFCTGDPKDTSLPLCKPAAPQ
jgi:hypothetical protein